jgi:hypothetical protein
MTLQAASNLSLNLIDFEGFKLFFAFMIPRFTVKGRCTMLGTLLPLIHKNLHDLIMDILQDEFPLCDNVAFTADTWAGSGDHAYLALIIHYIKTNFELRKFTVDYQVTKGMETKAAMSDLLSSMISNIPGLHLPTSMGMVNDESESLKHNLAFNYKINCLEHIINHTLKEALKPKCLQLFLRRVTDLTTCLQSLKQTRVIEKSHYRASNLWVWPSHAQEG